MEHITFGKYHYVLSAAIYLFFISGGFLNYNWGFMLLNPETEEGVEVAPKLFTC
jgi:hypothetical protein